MLLLVIAAVVPALMSCHISMILKNPMRLNYIRNSINWVHRGLDSSYQCQSSKSFHISSQALLARKKMTRERTVDRYSETENNTDDEVDDSKIFADAVKSLQRSLSNPSRALSSTSKDGVLIIIRIYYF